MSANRIFAEAMEDDDDDDDAPESPQVEAPPAAAKKHWELTSEANHECDPDRKRRILATAAKLRAEQGARRGRRRGLGHEDRLHPADSRLALPLG